MYVCNTYVCMYVNTYIRMYVCMYACFLRSGRVLGVQYIYTYIHVYIYIYKLCIPQTRHLMHTQNKTRRCIGRWISWSCGRYKVYLLYSYKRTNTDAAVERRQESCISRNRADVAATELQHSRCNNRNRAVVACKVHCVEADWPQSLMLQQSCNSCNRAATEP